MKSKFEKIADKIWRLEDEAEAHPDREAEIEGRIADLVKGFSLEDLLELECVINEKFLKIS